jgi:hypothetical protein
MSVRMGYTEALHALIAAAMRNGNSVTRSTAHYKRAVRALKVMGIDQQATDYALRLLEFHGDDNLPYPWLAKRLAKKAQP